MSQWGAMLKLDGAIFVAYVETLPFEPIGPMHTVESIVLLDVKGDRATAERRLQELSGRFIGKPHDEWRRECGLDQSAFSAYPTRDRSNP